MEKVYLMDGKISAAIHHFSEKFVICCHGLYSSKESEKYLKMAEMAGDEGISTVRFDFRGCGESGGDLLKSTLSNRIEDLREVVNYIRNNYSNAKIALFGSSLGGMVSIVFSSMDGEICSLAVLSTPYKIDNDIGMGKKFMEDLGRYDILKAVEGAPPVLIIHGREDELVPVEHAEKIYSHAPEDKKILFFDADHSFSRFRDEAVKSSLEWIKKHF